MLNICIKLYENIKIKIYMIIKWIILANISITVYHNLSQNQ